MQEIADSFGDYRAKASEQFENRKMAMGRRISVTAQSGRENSESHTWTRDAVYFKSRTKADIINGVDFSVRQQFAYEVAERIASTSSGGRYSRSCTSI